MPRNSRNVLSDLTPSQSKHVESEFIEFLKMDENRFIYDTSHPNHSNTEMKTRVFNEFGNIIDPPLTGKVN